MNRLDTRMGKVKAEVNKEWFRFSLDTWGDVGDKRAYINI